MDDARTSGRPLNRRRLVAAALVLTTLLALAAGTAWLMRGPQIPAEADPAVRQDARAAAERFAAGINTYDVKDLDPYVKRMKPQLTPGLAEQFEASTQDLLSKFAETGIVSTGKVNQVAIDSIDDDSADALASVSVTTTPQDVQYGQPDLRWRISLVRQDGTWLVDSFANVTVGETANSGDAP